MACFDWQVGQTKIHSFPFLIWILYITSSGLLQVSHSFVFIKVKTFLPSFWFKFYVKAIHPTWIGVDYWDCPHDCEQSFRREFFE